MTRVNPIAAVAAAPTPAVASLETAHADGATFGAVLDQAIRTNQAVAAAPSLARPARPATPAPAPSVAPRSGDAAESPSSGEPSPVAEAEPAQTPSLAEIALPIGALTSFLAAFIAMSLQAAPANGANAAGAGQGDASADGVAVAALGVSVSSGQQLGGAGELLALARLVGQGSAAGQEDGLAALFATLLDEVGGAAGSGDSIGQAISELASGKDGQGTAALFAAGAASAQSGAAPTDAASLGALVDALVELASRAGDSGKDGAAVALAAFARLGQGTSGHAAPAQLGLAAGGSFAEIARLVATLNGELGAAAGSLETDGAKVEGAEPSLRAANARTLVALADAAQAVKVGKVSGSSQVTVQLRPESLGKVTIEVERTSGGAVARVVASTAEAQRAIAENVGAVKDALAKIGVEVGRIEVSGPSNGDAATPESGFDTQLEAAQPGGNALGPVDASAARGASAPARADGPATRVAPNAESADGDGPAPEADQPAATGPAVATAGAARTATVELAGPAPEAGRAGVAHLARDIADQAAVLLGQGKSQFQLQLRPESLGRLQVRMTLDGGEVTVQMRAESAAAKSAIESNLGQLKQQFQERGVRVDRFEVVVQGAPGQLSQEQGHPRRSRGWVDPVRPRSNGRSEGDFAGALAAATRPVDFRA